MTSQRKIEANRRNSARSTGPRTPEGKRKVSQNAVKHGLTATTLVVLPHEDAEAYERRLLAWTAELNPKGDLDRYLAERAVKVSWQLDRADSYAGPEPARGPAGRRVRPAARGAVEAYNEVEDLDCRKLLRMGREEDLELQPVPEAPADVDEDEEPTLPFDVAEVNSRSAKQTHRGGDNT